MTVNEALETLNRVPEQYRDLELFGIVGSSGVTYDISIYGKPTQKEKGIEYPGPLDDEPVGFQFIPVYLG